MTQGELLFLLIGIGVCALVFNHIVDVAMKDDRVPPDYEEVYVDEDGNEIEIPEPPPGEVANDGYIIINVVIEKIGNYYHANMLADNKEVFLVNDESAETVQEDATRILSKKYPHYDLRIRFHTVEDDEEGEQ
jgi:hypothetical protein